VPQVRLVSLDGEPLGIVDIQHALDLAGEAGADLVEVAPNATPPVCRIMDFRKLQYEQQRKQKEARKHQRQIEVKSLRLRPSIDPHDYTTKLNQLRSFLVKGFKVKIMIVFKGAQLRRYELGTSLLDKMIEDVKDIAILEPGSRSQRRMITALITPTKETEVAAHGKPESGKPKEPKPKQDDSKAAPAESPESEPAPSVKE